MIRLANTGDLDAIEAVYTKARAFMRASGNMRQWINGYPQRELLEADIQKGQLFVITEDDTIRAVFAFILGDDPTYAYIEDGRWPNSKPYGTIHRIGTDGTIHGAVKAARDFALQYTDEVRADTHEDNKPMQHTLAKNGFVRCGIIYLEDGAPRIAYQYSKDRPILKTSDFYYELPERLIAQTPMEPRDAARMMVIHRDTGLREDRIFRDLPEYLRPGDVMVINQTKVIPARLLGEKEDTHVPVEILLLKRVDKDHWETLVRPGRRLKKGVTVSFGGGILRAMIGDTTDAGGRVVEFLYEGVFEELLDRLGEMPLPPYIHEKLQDPSQYQTIYAKQEGSAAAPTAGLHFTPEVMERVRENGIEIVPVLLHVGLGTFRPVKAEDVSEHKMHSEYYEVTSEAAEKINAARRNGGRIVCIGTTSVRTLETVVDDEGVVHPGMGNTSIFITPGVKLKATDVLLTNFHLPESTLLMLVSALMGREEALDAYREAVEKEYRFFSFGDCMLIL